MTRPVPRTTQCGVIRSLQTWPAMDTRQLESIGSLQQSTRSNDDNKEGAAFSTTWKPIQGIHFAKSTSCKGFKQSMRSFSSTSLAARDPWASMKSDEETYNSQDSNINNGPASRRSIPGRTPFLYAGPNDQSMLMAEIRDLKKQLAKANERVNDARDMLQQMPELNIENHPGVKRLLAEQKAEFELDHHRQLEKERKRFNQQLAAAGDREVDLEHKLKSLQSIYDQQERGINAQVDIRTQAQVAEETGRLAEKAEEFERRKVELTGAMEKRETEVYRKRQETTRKEELLARQQADLLRERRRLKIKEQILERDTIVAVAKANKGFENRRLQRQTYAGMKKAIHVDLVNATMRVLGSLSTNDDEDTGAIGDLTRSLNSAINMAKEKGADSRDVQRLHSFHQRLQTIRSQMFNWSEHQSKDAHKRRTLLHQSLLFDNGHPLAMLKASDILRVDHTAPASQVLSTPGVTSILAPGLPLSYVRTSSMWRYLQLLKEEPSEIQALNAPMPPEVRLAQQCVRTVGHALVAGDGNPLMVKAALLREDVARLAMRKAQAIVIARQLGTWRPEQARRLRDDLNHRTKGVLRILEFQIAKFARSGTERASLASSRRSRTTMVGRSRARDTKLSYKTISLSNKRMEPKRVRQSLATKTALPEKALGDGQAVSKPSLADARPLKVTTVVQATEHDNSSQSQPITTSAQQATKSVDESATVSETLRNNDQQPKSLSTATLSTYKPSFQATASSKIRASSKRRRRASSPVEKSAAEKKVLRSRASSSSARSSTNLQKPPATQSISNLTSETPQTNTNHKSEASQNAQSITGSKTNISTINNLKARGQSQSRSYSMMAHANYTYAKTRPLLFASAQGHTLHNVSHDFITPGAEVGNDNGIDEMRDISRQGIMSEDALSLTSRAQADGRVMKSSRREGNEDLSAALDDLHITSRPTSGEKAEDDLSETTSSTLSEQELPALTYQIPSEKLADAQAADPDSTAASWSFRLYESTDGESVSLHYYSSYDKAEAAAAMLLDEPVLGFDLEWEEFSKPGKHDIKRCVSMLQLANEKACHLFHIALFKGSTASELMPSSLSKILTSSSIAKAGVNVAGDSNRIRTCFGLEMQGVFELSHLYKLVNFGQNEPEKVDKRLVRLAEQVQQQLLLPLPKGAVRTSRWSSKLTLDQSEYAASDAYAGFRLFHALDEKRRAQEPTPPRPAFWELQLPIELADGTFARSMPRAKKPVMTAQDEDPDEFYDALEYQESDDGEGDTEVVKNEVQPVKEDRIKAVRSSGAEIDLANAWIEDWMNTRVSGTKSPLTAAPLRAYHLWHVQKFELEQTAAILRQPPILVTTVASYVADAVSRGHLQYDADRLRAALQVLPKTVHGRYRNLMTKLESVSKD